MLLLPKMGGYVLLSKMGGYVLLELQSKEQETILAMKV
jgi:hypothetical protein